MTLVWRFSFGTDAFVSAARRVSCEIWNIRLHRIWLFIMASQPTPQRAPPQTKALLRAYQPLVSLSKAILNPYFFQRRGGRLTSHDIWSLITTDSKEKYWYPWDGTLAVQPPTRGPLKGDMTYPINTYYRRCIWDLFLRVLSHWYHHFPYDYGFSNRFPKKNWKKPYNFTSLPLGLMRIWMRVCQGFAIFGIFEAYISHQ